VAYIFNLSNYPLRSEARHASEMVSEVLFGESFDIVGQRASWLKIKLNSDGYEGWIEHKAPFTDSGLDFDHIVMDHHGALSHSDEEIALPIGSRIGGSEKLKLHGKTFTVNARVRKPDDGFTTEDLVGLARSFLNSPYYWGGRTHAGIDCSGFVQVVFSVFGIALPRDAYQQAENGHNITFTEASTGDLAFFANETGKITHVGIILENGRIIHASEKVRIDRFDEQGIWREDIKEYSHQLHSVKQLLNS